MIGPEHKAREIKQGEMCWAHKTRATHSKERTFGSSGFLKEGTLIDASIVPHCRHIGKETKIMVNCLGCICM